MLSIKKVLMDRDGMTEDEADSLIEEAREELQDLVEDWKMEAAYEICADYFGLEPDYIMELL